jgi:hypothetical protein
MDAPAQRFQGVRNDDLPSGSHRLGITCDSGSMSRGLTMRHVVGNRIGRTDFFRNPAFLSALVDLLTMERRPRVLVHAAAVGQSPIRWSWHAILPVSTMSGGHRYRAPFLNIAQQGVYADNCLDKVPDVARRFFFWTKVGNRRGCSRDPRPGHVPAARQFCRFQGLERLRCGACA